MVEEDGRAAGGGGTAKRGRLAHADDAGRRVRARLLAGRGRASASATSGASVARRAPRARSRSSVVTSRTSAPKRSACLMAWSPSSATACGSAPLIDRYRSFRNGTAPQGASRTDGWMVAGGARRRRGPRRARPRPERRRAARPRRDAAGLRRHDPPRPQGRQDGVRGARSRPAPSPASTRCPAPSRPTRSRSTTTRRPASTRSSPRSSPTSTARAQGDFLEPRLRPPHRRPARAG